MAPQEQAPSPVMIPQLMSHFRVLEKLGDGGMGIVYKAEDLKLGRTVAQKLRTKKSFVLLGKMHLGRVGFMTLKTCSIASIPVLAAIMSGVLSAEQGANRPPLPATRGAAVGRKVTLGGVPNFGEVSPTLYRGGHPTVVGFEKLAQLGIKIIVDVRGGPSKSEQEQVTKLGMQYVSIPWRCFHPQDKKIAQFLALVEKNRGKKIFVHCRLGDDRTGLMIATYRMAEQGWTADEAMKEMKAFGFSWAHHYLICPGLASYEAKFPQRFQESPAFQDVRDPGRGAETKP